MKRLFPALVAVLLAASFSLCEVRASEPDGVPEEVSAESSSEPAAVEEKSQGTMDVFYKNEVIDVLEAKDMDIREVIETVARKTGMNIVTGQNIQGRVTIFLKDVNARDALRIVLESNGLAFADEDGIVLIMTASEYLSRYGHSFGQEIVTRLVRVHFASVADLAALLNEMKSEQGRVIANKESKNLVIMDTPDKVSAMEALAREMDVQTVTQTVALKYAKAEDLIAQLRSTLTPGIGKIECDPAANSLAVTDTPEKVGRIKQSIEQMDSLGRQITLQVKLVHVVLNSEHLGGVDWSGILEDFRNIRLWGTYDFLDGEAADRVLGLGVIAEADFPTLLEALDTVGIVKEYPVNDITLTQSEAVRAVVRMDDLSLDLGHISAEQAIENDGSFRTGDASFELYLKVSIDAENNVEIGVIPHEPRPAKKVLRAGAHKASLVTEEGQSLVIGGLIATEKVATTRKIPLMGDLPLLGFAFRYHGSSVRREEFVVFVTPKIMGGEPKEAAAKSEVVPVSEEKEFDVLLPEAAAPAEKKR